MGDEKPKETPKDEWESPEWVWEPWHKRLGFKLDAAATITNTIVPTYLTKENDALSVDWRTRVPQGSAVWVNPPYSQAAGPLERWIAKFKKESRENGMRIVSLLQLDTSTAWWNEVWDRSVSQFREGIHGHFIGERVRFINPNTGKEAGSPKFPSVILYWDRALIYPNEWTERTKKKDARARKPLT